MNFKTFGEIRSKVEKDLDIENEDFIQADLMVSYCNDAIRECVTRIMKTNEDYFLRSAQLDNGAGGNGLVSGQDKYPLPDDIFITKLRGMVYNDGSRVYRIPRMKNKDIFAEVACENLTPSATDFLSYILVNPGVYDPTLPLASGYLVKFIPTPQETGDFVTLWYIRQPKEIPLVSAGSQALTDAVYVDIPEYYSFIKAAMAYKIAVQEGHPKALELKDIYNNERNMMIMALQDRTPDNYASEIEGDYSHYGEHL